MNYRHIQIFLKVVEQNNNLSKAARELFVSQPAVTLAIREIEEEYGVKLFDRLSRRLYLTGAGEVFLEYARRLSAITEDMNRTFEAWNENETIRVGASMTIGTYYIADYAGIFQKNNPAGELKVTVEASRFLEEKISKNLLDLALVETPVQNDAMTAEEYARKDLALIAPPDAGIEPGQELTLEELAGQKFLLREKGSGTREIFDGALKQYGKQIEPLWEAGTFTALINGVKAGQGISVLPVKAVEAELKAGNLITFQVGGLRFEQRFYILAHKDKHYTETMKKFIELVRRYHERDCL